MAATVGNSCFTARSLLVPKTLVRTVLIKLETSFALPSACTKNCAATGDILKR